MSFAETRQIMADMQEIMELLGQAEIKTRNLTAQQPQMERILNTFRSLERVALRYLAIVRQLGLPDDVEQVIQVIAKVVVMIRMAQISLNMLAGGPLGIAMGVAGFAMIGLSAGNMMEGY